MTRHIAFLSSSFEYTQGVLRFARCLETRGYLVHWISFRGYEFHWLLEQGVPRERILDTLAGFDPGAPADEVDARLMRLDGGRPPYVNHLISMDRMLKRKPNGFARAYIAHVAEAVRRFLADRSITLVSGGRDSALQTATSKVCEQGGVAYVIPTAVRLPDDRYGFCAGYTEARFLRFHEPGPSHRRAAADFLAAFRVERPVPSGVLFERLNNRFIRRIPRDIALWTAAARRGKYDRGNDFTRYTMGTLLRMYARRRWNAAHVRMAPPFQKPGTRPFVLYAYQMQPESGIDTLAAHYSDQIPLIRQIARAVPASHDFYVKPHPDHVGGLARQRMDEIRRIPGVTLIDPFASGRSLMHRSSLVITPSGSMAFEAGLHGLPAVIFADEFFGVLPTIATAASIAALPDLLGGMLAAPPKRNDAAIVEFLAVQFANTWVGRVTDYLGPWTDEEMRDMAGAYDTMYLHVVRPSSAAPERSASA